MSRVYRGLISLAAIGASLLFLSLPGVCGSAFARTPVSPAASPGGGVFYVGADGHIWAWYTVNGVWHNNVIAGAGGEPAAANTSPAASPGNGVFYVGADRYIWAWYTVNGVWHNNVIAGSGGEPAGSPPPVETTPVPTPLPRPKAARALHVKVVLTWTWRYRVTRLDKVRLGSFPGDMRLAFRCRGRGCPRVAMASAVGIRRVRRLLRAWEGRRFRAGDRLLVTLTAPGYLPERAALLMRVANKPRVRSL